jgi:hypothetical protein
MGSVMGISDVRNAFVTAGGGKLRCSDCQLSVIQDGNNSQRLRISGFDGAGVAFDLDSGPFDPKTNPAHKAAEMAGEFLKKAAGFRQPPHQQAAARR